MMNVSEGNPLPPGWDFKYDSGTGKRYFINYFTRNTSLEDPRLRFGQPQPVESIPLQEWTGLQRSSPAQHTSSASPVGRTSPVIRHTGTCFGPSVGRTSPQIGRSMVPVMGAAALNQPQLSPNTVEQSVLKINAMFPTVSETHIKTLLLKFHNREAVVMSALQVEKHPLTTPGPYTPPMSVRQFPGCPVLQMTPPLVHRGGLGPAFVGFRNTAPRPHSSPKMKLSRFSFSESKDEETETASMYLKSVFPVVEETLLLDTLCSSENNVTVATEALLTMGYDKRATPPPRVQLNKREEQQRQTPPPPPPPRMKSVEEKQMMKVRLRAKNPDIPERVVSIALDSVDFDESKAEQILAMMQSDHIPPAVHSNINCQSDREVETDTGVLEVNCKESASEQLMSSAPLQSISSSLQPASPPLQTTVPCTTPHYRTKNKNDVFKMMQETSSCGEMNHYKSPFLNKPRGRNSHLAKGPNDNLLLPDYMTWTGPSETALCRNMAKGPDKRLVMGPSGYGAQGPDPRLRKGPNRALARGSIYCQQLTTSEPQSRGK